MDTLQHFKDIFDKLRGAADFLRNFCKLKKFLSASLLGCTIISTSAELPNWN